MPITYPAWVYSSTDPPQLVTGPAQVATLPATYTALANAAASDIAGALPQLGVVTSPGLVTPAIPPDSPQVPNSGSVGDVTDVPDPTTLVMVDPSLVTLSS